MSAEGRTKSAWPVPYLQSLESELSRLREENERLKEQCENAHKLLCKVDEVACNQAREILALRAKYEGEGAREHFEIYNRDGVNVEGDDTLEGAERAKAFYERSEAFSEEGPYTIVRFREVRE